MRMHNNNLSPPSLCNPPLRTPPPSGTRAHSTLDSTQKTSIRIRLARIPHHHSSEIGEGFAVRDHRLQRRAIQVATPCGASVGWHTKEHFDVLVGANGFGPVVPYGEVKARLVGCCLLV